MFLADSVKTEADLSLETEAAVTLRELFERLCEGDQVLLFKLIDEQKKLRPHVNIFVGTKNCRGLEGIDTPVSNDDKVSVFPSLSGG